MRRHRSRGLSPFAIGVIALVLVVVGTYFAFTKANPFSSPYELHAVFESANNVQRRSPVRIAGVHAGKVTGVQPLDDGSGMAKVTMEIDKSALPIKKDATLKVRSRIFLEGNYFVDLHPGSPSAPEVESGHTIPPNQTAFPVQFGQVLSALQSDTREDLQTFLKEYSSALRGSGAKGFNNAIKYWEDAYRTTSQVSQATLGLEQHDLSRLLRGQGKVFGALARDEEALKGLVTNLNTTVAAFAEQEDNLRATIPALRNVLRIGRPALQSLDSALPSIRAFARDALPGARSSVPTLDAQIPFIRQARLLVERDELPALVRDLRITIPQLVRLNRNSTKTFAQSRALARCQNKVLLPFSTTPIPDPDFPWHTGESFFEESPRAFVGLSGESRIADANSPMFRVLAGGGPALIANTALGESVFGASLLPVESARPARPEKAPVFRPNVPCETNEPPDMNGVSTAGDRNVSANPTRDAGWRKMRDEADAALEKMAKEIGK